MPICYEHPLNERIRVLLRLEMFFKQVADNAGEQSEWNGCAALQGLSGICGLTSRAELKNELLKELDRQAATLERLRQMPGVDAAALDGVLTHIGDVAQQVQQLSNQAQETVRKVDLLNIIRQRSAMPGGTGAFDVPALHHWLRQEPILHIRCFEQWLGPFKPLREAAALLLRLIRDSTLPEEEVAKVGLYKKTLNSSNPSQLVRIFLPERSSVFPEISGSKHRFSVRFLTQSDFNQRPRYSTEDVVFQLACCTL